MSPLNTLRVPQHNIAERDHQNLPLHAMLHKQTGRKCCVVVHNHNSSWLSCQRDFVGLDTGKAPRFPAWDCNCAMFSGEGLISVLHLPYPFSSTKQEADTAAEQGGLGSQTKVIILPNRATAVVGDTVKQATMRTIYVREDICGAHEAPWSL